VSPDSDFKRRMRDLKRGLRWAAKGARSGGSASSDQSAGKVNLAHRANVATARNFGGEGSKYSVSSTQKVRIRQDGQEIREEIEETRTTSEEV
jgi:hypothetical protein